MLHCIKYHDTMSISRGGHMILVNDTYYDKALIESILTAAGADITQDFTLWVDWMSEECHEAARCGEGQIVLGMYYQFQGRHVVRLDKRARLDTLAHELKHVEQALYLGDDFKALTASEDELTGYEARWYEVEAREFQAGYRR